jgi:hypothetical protein
MTFVMYAVRGVSEETKDLSLWTVNCPDHQYACNVAIRHQDRERATDTEFLKLLSLQRDMVVMEMQDIGCEHPVPPVEEWEK